ncbi:unnamed protein product [Sympodiomycopsis kandeliae]
MAPGLVLYAMVVFTTLLIIHTASVGSSPVALPLDHRRAMNHHHDHEYQHIRPQQLISRGFAFEEKTRNFVNNIACLGSCIPKQVTPVTVPRPRTRYFETGPWTPHPRFRPAQTAGSPAPQESSSSTRFAHLKIAEPSESASQAIHTPATMAVEAKGKGKMMVIHFPSPSSSAASSSSSSPRLGSVLGGPSGTK